MDKIHLATISILIKDRQKYAPEVNDLLTQSGQIILARLGLNVEHRCVEHCTAVITVTLQATAQEIQDLTQKLNSLPEIVAKENILTQL